MNSKSKRTMKLKCLILLSFTITSLYTNAQKQATFIMKDGREISDKVFVVEDSLVSLRTEEKYSFNDINELEIIRSKKKRERFFIVDTKRFKDETRVTKGLGNRIYDSKYLEIYVASFAFNLDYRTKFDYDRLKDGTEVFIKRKNEPFAYNVACIDGFGCKAIVERLAAFFYDCPELVTKIKKREINKMDIIKIADYYNLNCDDQ